MPCRKDKQHDCNKFKEFVKESSVQAKTFEREVGFLFLWNGAQLAQVRKNRVSNYVSLLTLFGKTIPKCSQLEMYRTAQGERHVTRCWSGATLPISEI